MLAFVIVAGSLSEPRPVLKERGRYQVVSIFTWISGNETDEQSSSSSTDSGLRSYTGN